MLKELSILIQEYDNKRLMRRVETANQNVLGYFTEFGIKIGPVPIVLSTQDELKATLALNMLHLDDVDPDIYVKGVYSSIHDLIMLDQRTTRWGWTETIEQVLTHEYAHRLFRKFMFTIYERSQYQSLDMLALSGTVGKFDPLLTEADRRNLEFDIYFEEMFAESVALYLTKQAGGDGRWFDYSRTQKGTVLGRDREFTTKLEGVLYNVFFERLFSHGLRSVAVELPLSYHFARDAFDKEYKRLLSSPPP